MLFEDLALEDRKSYLGGYHNKYGGRNEPRSQVFLGWDRMTGPHLGLSILSLITVVIFMFIYKYPYSYVPYIIIMLYPLWWLAITISYKSWGRGLTWIWACITLALLWVVLPLTIILDIMLDRSTYVLIFFVVLFIYSASYYLTIKRKA